MHTSSELSDGVKYMFLHAAAAMWHIKHGVETLTLMEEVFIFLTLPCKVLIVRRDTALNVFVVF